MHLAIDRQAACVLIAGGLFGAGGATARALSALVDGVHFFRNGGTLTSLRTEIDRVKHVQLCDVAGPAPSTAEAMIAEARGKRLAPGDGELPLGELVAIADGAASVSVEVPLSGSADAEEHLKRLFEGAVRIFKPGQ